VEQYMLDTFFLELAVTLIRTRFLSLQTGTKSKTVANYEKMNHLSDFSNFLGHTNQHWECRLHVCTSCGDSTASLELWNCETASLELWNCSSYMLWSICVLKWCFYSYHSNMAE